MGDFATIIGVQKFISEAADYKITFYEKKLFDDFNDADVDKINSEMDIVIIGGGGFLFPKPEFKSGCLWNTDYSTVSKIKKPIVFYSIGLNANVANNPKKYRVSREAIAMLKKAMLIGSRDHWTKSWMEDLGIGSKLVPCPSMFISEYKEKQEKKRNNSLIMLNLIPKSYFVNLNVFESAMASIIKEIKSMGFSFQINSHNSDVPVQYEEEFSEKYDISLKIFSNPVDLIEEYGKARMSIVMRAHPILFSITKRTPFISVKYNYKSESFLELFNMNNMNNIVSFPGIIDRIKKDRYKSYLSKRIFDVLEYKNYQYNGSQNFLDNYMNVNKNFAKEIIQLIK